MRIGRDDVQKAMEELVLGEQAVGGKPSFSNLCAITF